MENKTIEKLVDEIDFILIGFEDSMHGEDGKNVTHARRLLSKLRAAKSTKGEVREVYGEWQLCPKCQGAGRARNYDNLIPCDLDICDVCHGAKIIAKPVTTLPIRDEEKSDAPEFLEWTLGCGWKLNPHKRENRWRKIDNVSGLAKPILDDGVTTTELYQIFLKEKGTI